LTKTFLNPVAFRLQAFEKTLYNPSKFKVASNSSIKAEKNLEGKARVASVNVEKFHQLTTPRVTID